MLRAALLLFISALLGGCGNKLDQGLPAPRELDGVYESSAAVGPLGELTLTLRLREGSVRIFEAELASADAEVEDSLGTGTLGDDHLIVNFDIGAPDDFYFQGFVLPAGSGAPTGLSGTFIFADQSEQLAVEFTRTGDAPPLPDPAV